MESQEAQSNTPNPKKLSIRERRAKAKEKSFYTLAPNTEDEARLKLRPVKFQQVLDAIGMVNPEVFKEVATGEDDDANSMYKTLNKYVNDPENFKGQMDMGQKMQDAYLVLGIDKAQSDFAVVFDPEDGQIVDESALSVTDLRYIYNGEELNKLNKRIKALSGIFEETKAKK